MTTFVRRFLVLTTVMFWQGGFTFYAAVVVAVGSDVLGSHLEQEQGLVTRSVTAQCVASLLLMAATLSA